MQGLWTLKDQSIARQFVTDTVVLVAAVAPAIVYGCTPATPDGGQAKVMAYTWKRSWEDTNSPALFSATSRHNLCTHPCIMVLDLTFDDRTWHIVNFYNDIRDRSSLNVPLVLDLDPSVPTLVVGDFNTHSHSWSPPDINPSPWAEQVEEWAIGNL